MRSGFGCFSTIFRMRLLDTAHQMYMKHALAKESLNSQPFILNQPIHF